MYALSQDGCVFILFLVTSLADPFPASVAGSQSASPNFMELIKIMVEYLILNIWSKNKVNVKNNRPVIFLLFSYLKFIAEAQFWENEFQLFTWSYKRRQK